jgi:hypothetical protein
MAFVTGLPGTGKSLVIHQLAHLAVTAGRVVHLLQWDVARPVFEASPAGRRYPVVDGVTQALVRKAVGLWARTAVVTWARRHPEPEHLLIGEAPLVGGRLVELVQPARDEAEAMLSAPSCPFVIPLPSAEVRRFVEAERERRMARPQNDREREDAPPSVLRNLWRELHDVARQLGLTEGEGADAPYDADLYRRVYARVLRRRHAETLPLDTVLPTTGLSVYDFGVVHTDVVPTLAEADAAVEQAEALNPDAGDLARDVDRWWATG